MTNTIQKRFKVSSTQLLYQSSPYQAATLCISGPFLDAALTNQNVFSFDYNPYVVVSAHHQLYYRWVWKMETLVLLSKGGDNAGNL